MKEENDLFSLCIKDGTLKIGDSTKNRCSDPGRNSNLSSNQCSLGSTHVNTNLSVDPFDAIFDPTGNPVFQDETWDGGPIKCGQN